MLELPYRPRDSSRRAKIRPSAARRANNAEVHLVMLHDGPREIDRRDLPVKIHERIAARFYCTAHTRSVVQMLTEKMQQGRNIGGEDEAIP